MQGTLGSEATCATTSSESLPRQSEPSRHMAAMPQPTSRRQRKKLAHVAKKTETTSVLTPGSASAVEPPGVVKADDRTAIIQASASETDEPDESRMDSVEEDEKGNMNSPPETVTKPGSTLASSAVTRPGGETAGHKRKTEVGPTPPKTKKKKTKCGPSLGTTFKETEDNDLPGVVLVGVVLVQEQPYKIVLCIQINKV